jgi:hypothetical protein
MGTRHRCEILEEGPRTAWDFRRPNRKTAIPKMIENVFHGALRSASSDTTSARWINLSASAVVRFDASRKTKRGTGSTGGK